MLKTNQHKLLYSMLFPLPFICVGVLGFHRNCLAVNQVMINEVMVGERGSSDSEFIELFNTAPHDIDLETLPLKVHTINSRGADTNKTISFKNSIIKSDGYFLIASEDYYKKHSNGLTIDATYSASLVAGGAVYISTSAVKDTDIIDLICWGKSQKCALALNEPKDGYSLEKSGQNSWEESYAEGGTPGKENLKKPDPKTYSQKIRISELLPDPEESPEKKFEYVEIYNFESLNIDLSGWKIKDRNGSFALSSEIAPGSYAVFFGTVTLNNDGDEIQLVNPDGEIVNSVIYSKVKEGYSYSYGNNEWTWTAHQTSGQENKFDEKKTYSSAVYLNEIFPNPAGDEIAGEYIEIYNSSEDDMELGGWTLRDSSKTGKYVLSEGSRVKGGGFLVFYRTDFKFALNNSGNEAVYLLNPNQDIVSGVEYAKSKEGVSYNFDGNIWRWSKHLTPGEKNQFNNLPKIEIKTDKKVYKGIYANFEVNVNDPDHDKIKVSWIFGDGRKSYKQKTRHKYLKIGEYVGSVQIFDGSEEEEEKFTVKVEEFPKPKVRIVRIMPNPQGKDSDGEWIIVKNKSKKEVNLKNWSIATGKNSKKLVNHPISGDLIIKAGRKRVITREFSKFTLNNKKARIELRYPNGKVASSAKYKRADGIKDDEVYEKIKGAGWQWMGDGKTKEQEGSGLLEQKDDSGLNQEDEEVLDEAKEEFPEELIGKKSENTDNKGIKRIATSFQINKKIDSYLTANTGRVLGAAIIDNGGAEYLFTGSAEYFPSDHYAVKFFKKLWQKINSATNKLILRY